jgi:uncharacterized protein (TIGR02453 family)
MSAHFTKKTFDYFDLAKKNTKNEKWFIKNKGLYDEHVKEPFSILIQQLDLRFGDKLPKIEINPKKISRPLRPANKRTSGGEIIKPQTHMTLWEKKVSLFEWNPAIHIQFGAEKEDNLYGVGLYMVSSRQLKLMRRTIDENFEEFDALLNDKKFKKVWGGLAGEQYKRFPKDYDENSPSAKYLWFKQFYVGRDLTRKDVIAKNFFQKVGDEVEVALPFFNWVRETVGTYKKNKFDF